MDKEAQPEDIDKKRRRLLTWLWRAPVILAFTSVIWIIQKAYKIHFNKPKPKKVIQFASQKPVIIAPINSFTKVWDKVEFMIGGILAIVLYVPKPINGGISIGEKHFIAFSRVCTHLSCPVNFTSDIEAIALASNHRVSNPVLVCHCHLSIFDALQAGQAISGPAIEPLPRIELKVKNDQLLATGIEK